MRGLSLEATETKPVLVIRPSRGFRPIPIGELIRFRDLLFTLAIRDVKLRYRQTALGAIWVVLQPLIGAGLFSFVFGKVAKLPSEGLPYFIFSYAGLLGWTAFSGTLTKSSASMVGNAQLVSKVYFPRLILPLSSSFGVALDFAVGLGMLAVLLVIYQVPLTIAILALPLCLAVALMMSLGIGMFFASLAVSYRDVQYVVPVLVQFLLYGSPVAYSATAVPDGLREVFGLNPLVGLMEAFRWSLLGTSVANWGLVVYSGAFALLVFLFGALAFQKMERRFADVI